MCACVCLRVSLILGHREVRVSECMQPNTSELCVRRRQNGLVSAQKQEGHISSPHFQHDLGCSVDVELLEGSSPLVVALTGGSESEGANDASH